ncbi:hypothetical protein F9K33_04310 [bacterium]|nr:MAG: hypothetical protein F9K33_04310 [bacterium]
MPAKIFFYVLLILFLCETDFLTAQRRYIDNAHGFSLGLGGSFSQGSGETSESVDLTTGFAKSAEFIFSAGKISANHASTGYFACGAELYGDNTIAPVVDVGYFRFGNKEKYGKHGLAIACGLSVLAVNTKEIVIAPEVGFGTSLSLDKMNSGVPRILSISISAGIKPSPGKLILVHLGTAGEKSLWVTTMGLSILFW